MPASNHPDTNGAASSLSVAWERAGRPSAAGLPVAVEITFTPAPAAPNDDRRLPLSVGLAIDRSGSMSGEKLRAARRAAIGVVEGLADGERFAAAAFDTDVTDVSPSVRLDDAARARLAPRLADLDAGASTALFDGFARAAELVAAGGPPGELDSWVLVLSDGMGNHGLTEPDQMRTHAAALAERGIRTITVGIGDDYEARQLTALADGGGGEFHHASNPSEIVEIVLGELRALRTVVARDLRLDVTARGAQRWLLLGGDATCDGESGRTRFDRVNSGRVMRAVALLWPAPGVQQQVSVDAAWRDASQNLVAAHLHTSGDDAPAVRDTAVAARAARLWHASILARALEINEAGDFEKAVEWLRRARTAFEAYAEGLPGMSELVEALEESERRIGRAWRTLARREVYAMARKEMMGKDELRDHAPVSYSSALRMEP